MKKLLFSIMALLAVASTSKAQNALSVADITLPQNGEATLTVSFQLDAADTYTSYSFNLELPSDLEFVMDSGTDVAYTKGNCYDATHSVTANLSDGVVKVACLSISSKTLTSTEGILLTFTVRPTKTIAVGQTLTGTISNILLVPVEGSKQNLASSSFTVTISEPTETRIVLSETSTTMPTAAENVDVRVKRTIKANEWSTICLPFSMNSEQIVAAFGNGVQLEEFTGAVSEFDNADNVVGIKVNFSDVSAIEANHPYIIKVREAITEFTVDGVDINPEEDEAYVEFDNGKTGSRRVVYSGFYGTYHAGTVLDKHTLFLSDNKFWYSAGLTKMKAFRSYFDFLDVLSEVESASARILMSFEDKATGISTTHSSSLQKEGNSCAVYNLNGQQVAKPSKGLYIKDGRKVVVK